MKRLIIAAAAIIAVSATMAQNTTSTHQYEDAIQVNGRAERKVTPDRIYVAITLKDGEPKGQTVETLEGRMRRDLAVLGIDTQTSLRVTSMANAPRKRNSVDTRRSYELVVGDATTLGAVFEVLGEMGVSEAGVTRLTHSRIEELRSEVRVEAVKNAQKIAGELAEALKQSIGRAVLIQDGGFYESAPVPMYKTRAMVSDAIYMSAEAAGGTESALEMQQITLTYNVSAKFMLWYK